MSKMKKLEELGISPAPWELWNVSGMFNKLVNLRDNYEVAKAQDGSEVHFCSLLKDKAANLANARIIAAAPELYECLREEFEKICTNDGKCTDCQFVGQCRVKKWRTALAKASGEGDVK